MKKMMNMVKEFFKENWKFLVFLLCFYLVMNYELPYVIYTPGGAIDMSERVSGENTYDEAGSFSMTYVSMVKGSLPFLALSYVIPNWDIVSKEEITYDGDDLKKTVEIDKIYMKEAISNATYVTFEKAGIEYSETNEHDIVTIVSDKAKTELKYGDEILKIDGEDYKGLKEFQNYISVKKPGDKVKITYSRNDKEYTDETELIDLSGVTKVGISIASISDFESEYNIKVKTKSSESGPSGGLMTTLEIYNQITEDDITGGLTIMGTGTIDKDGTVGEIGGVKYKLVGAVKNKADVFICPKENLEEAEKVAKENHYDIIVIGVSNFDEAITKIQEEIN